jgi:siroheme synthase-like protein
MKTKRYYPINLDVNNLPCLVVGGGKVAERKVVTLLSVGAKLIVVSPAVTPLIGRLAQKGKITHIQSRYQTAHAKGMRLVIGATGDTAVNEKVFRDAEKRGIPSNIVDCPSLCRFIVPAVIQCGDISLAISTAGAAPGITALMRKEIEKTILIK